MHVSLSRRTYRVGLTMKYWVWFCFGLLAVVPWQVIRGQDQPDQTATERQSTGKSWDDAQGSKSNASGNRTEKTVSKPDPNWLSVPSPGSLIFRSQNPPPGPAPANGPIPPAYQMNPVPEGEPDDDFMQSEMLTGRSGEAYGIQTRASIYTGPAIGRKHQILPVEMMPYAFLDNNVFFADIRGFTDFVNGYGGNFGGGYRHYFPRRDRIFGVNAYFDYDNTSGALFREVGFGAESLGALYDLRANAYLPFGNTSQQLSLTNINGTQQFVGHLLKVDQQRILANALHGFDSEIGVPLPGRVGRRHDLRVFGGGYWFEGTELKGFGGWKARIQGNVFPSIAVNLQVSHDQAFQTNVVFGATWTYGGYKQPSDVPKTQYDRMTTPVIRSYNMIVGLATQVNKGVTVVNPATGAPYFFEHVASYATGPIFDGTVEHPFLTVADAQGVAVPNDIIFVHANSTYSGVALGLQPDIRVLGEASTIDHTVSTAGGQLLLPHPTPGVTVRPLFTNSPSNGVVLANNSEFSGFQIGNAAVPGSGPAGVGILGFQVSNVEVRQTDVSFSGGEGVNLTQTSGTVTFQGDVINAPAAGATAFHVNGTTGTVIFSSDPLTQSRTPTPGVINNTGGIALLIENTALGSIVNFNNSTVNDTAGLGIQVLNDAGQIQLGNANLTNEGGIGLNILNDSGNIISGQTITISNVLGDAINIQNLAATGQVTFLPTGNVNISNRSARGVNLLDNAGTVGFLSPLIIAANGFVGLPAIEYAGSSGNAAFGTITIANGGRGILIDPDAGGVSDTGQFAVRGSTTINTPAADAITVFNVDSIVSFNTVSINNRGAIGIEILDTRDPVSFTGLTTITNTAPATTPLPGIDIRGNGPLATVTFQNATITGATGPNAPGFNAVGVNMGGTGPDVNPGQIGFTVLNVTSTFGTAVAADNVGISTTNPVSGGLIVNQGTLNATFGPAVDIQNSVLNATFTSVTSVQSNTNGIILANNTPFNNTLANALNNFAFTVTGNAAGRGSGGSIVQANGNGVTAINTGGISLSNMNFIQNGIGGGDGVNVNNTIHLKMFNDGVIQNNNDGVFAINVPQVDITGSSFTQNGVGTGAGHQIHLSATQILSQISPTGGSYIWNITDNITANGFAGGFVTALTGGDPVLIDDNRRLQDPISGLTTPLIFNFNDNSIINNILNTSSLNVAWIGPESGNINLNRMTLTGQNTAFFINNADLNFLTNYNMLGNTVTAVGQANVGLLVNNNGPTDLQIGNIVNRQTGVVTPSTWTFTSAGGNAVNATANVAMQFTTGPNSNLDIFSNTITMTGNAANPVQDVALNFAFLQAPTTVTISNNLITMTNEPIANGEGVQFLATNGTINLNGPFNNIISINGLANQAGTQWVFVTAGASTRGQFRVNNFFVP